MEKEYILIYCYCHPNIFEGEYLNGLRHGWGKYYDEGILRFECEYLYGKKMEKLYNMMNLAFLNIKLYIMMIN